MRNYLMRGMLAVALVMMWGGCGTTPIVEDNSCEFANDGACDDGRNCADFAVCDLGTDATDCAGVGDCPPENSCVYHDDGECDDGRAGAASSACDSGTDENDCG
jgi:hypothetical protein